MFKIQEHQKKVSSVWNAGGGNYNDISRGIADSIEHAIFRLSPRPGEKILDLATGTGWTSRGLARSGAVVTGLDLAEDLLKNAIARGKEERLEIKYIHGDAEELPFENGEFDAVISTCGIMFVSHPEKAASEVARVCRVGGRMALTTWTPDGTLFKMFSIMKKFMPPSPIPPPPSPFEWGKRERIQQLFGSNFDLKFEDATSFFREPSAEEAWRVFSTGYGPTKSLVANLSPERCEEFKKEFIAFHAQFGTDLGICVPRDYLLTVGIRR